jgi:hypothetical protein
MLVAAAVVIVIIAGALTYRVHLHKIAVIVDVDMISDAALAGVEAIRKARSFETNIAVSTPIQGLLGLVDRVHALHERAGRCLLWEAETGGASA